MKKERTDSLEYIAKKHKQEQEEYLKAGVVKRVDTFPYGRIELLLVFQIHIL